MIEFFFSCLKKYFTQLCCGERKRDDENEMITVVIKME